MEELFDDEGVDEEFEIEGNGKKVATFLVFLALVSSNRTPKLNMDSIPPWGFPKQNKMISLTRTLTNQVQMRKRRRTRMPTWRKIQKTRKHGNDKRQCSITSEPESHPSRCQYQEREQEQEQE